MMLLKITSIADRGDHEKERVVLKAVADGDVGRYAVFRSFIGADKVPTTRITDVFWFPDKSIRTDDLVILYTKGGTTSERPQPSGHTAHFYYWGRTAALWPKDAKHVPVLIWASQWQAFVE